jgi:ankyrin repeat protein
MSGYVGSGIVRIREGRITAFCAFAASGDIGGMGAILRIDRSVIESEALERAAENEQLESINFLISERVDLKAHGGASLVIAAASGKLDAIKLLTDKGVDSRNVEALISSSEAGHLSIVRFFLESGIDADREGERERFSLKEAAAYDQVAVMKLLIEYGANVDKQNASGTTALMDSAYYNSQGAAALLIESHANVRMKDNQKRNALDLAMMSDSTEVRDLIERKLGRNPLLAAKRGVEKASSRVKEAIR